MGYKAGFAKIDMTAFVRGIGMMGYGQFHNTVEEVATPLWCRCFYLKSDQETFVLVHLEQAFVTIAIKEEILKRIPELSQKNLLVTAQHTHSAPGGYSHYPFYNFTIPNFRHEVFEKVVSSAVRAIQTARSQLTDVTLEYGEHTIPEDKEVAFNRSMRALLNNSDAPDLTTEERHRGVNRTMEALWVKDVSGEILGMLNWFGVHATSISSYNKKIHHDNKGIAADLFEKNYPKATAFFLQSSAGDVSPNFVWDKKSHRMIGKFKDQYESAAFNGEIQFRESEKATPTQKLSSTIQTQHGFFNFARMAAPPAHGVGFFKGTLEGPGVSQALGEILKVITRVSKRLVLLRYPEKKAFYEAHGNKDILLDHESGRFVGLPISFWRTLPMLPDPTIREVQRAAKNKALDTLPWVPATIPFQMIRLGDLVLISVPGEVTTHAGLRLKDHVMKKLSDPSVKKILLTTYANGYMGYVTTPEEYDVQCYEGGHTVYGRGTLEAIMKAFGELIDEARGVYRQDESIFHFPTDELNRRST